MADADDRHFENRYIDISQRLTDTDLCSCGETQTISQIVESCHLTKLNGGLSRLHSAECGRRRCFVVDQLWFMTHIREEKKDVKIIRFS